MVVLGVLVIKNVAATRIASPHITRNLFILVTIIWTINEISWIKLNYLIELIFTQRKSHGRGNMLPKLLSEPPAPKYGGYKITLNAK